MSARSSAVGGDGQALAAFPELVEFVKSVNLDISRNPIPPALSDAALIDAVREVGGKVHIGLKPASAAPSRQTGIIPGMYRPDVLRARNEVRAAGVQIVQTFRNSAAFVAIIPAELAPVLRNLPMVDYIEPSLPYVLLQSTQDTSWGAKKVAADWVWRERWNFGRWSRVTILDTGADRAHRFNGDGDGPANPTTHCYYVPAYWNSCDDDHGHGSHVAGIAAAWNNDFGYIGIAPDPAGTTVVKVCGYVNGILDCPVDAIVSGLDHTVSNGWRRQIVNMSFGSPEYVQLIAEYVARSADAGNLLIGAAGNNPNQWNYTGVFYPARHSQVVAVSGTLQDDSFASSMICPRFGIVTGSNHGPEVELSAPFYARSMWLNGTYEWDCGTSMAAPVVTGIAALVWTEYPEWTAGNVRSKLASSSVDLGSTGRDSYFGYGRVNAAAAVITPPFFYSATITGPAQVQPNAGCLFQASTDLPNPTSYEWAIDGLLQSETSGLIRVSHGGPSYVLSVTIRNAEGTMVWDDHPVTVNSSAPECLDQ